MEKGVVLLTHTWNWNLFVRLESYKGFGKVRTVGNLVNRDRYIDRLLQIYRKVYFDHFVCGQTICDITTEAQKICRHAHSQSR